MVSGVKQTGRNGGLVTLADEAWHVGLYHYVLLGNSFTIKVAIEHVGSIGYTHKAPCRQTLRKGELQRSVAVLVSDNVGIAERCFVEVFANLNGGIDGRIVDCEVDL